MILQVALPIFGDQPSNGKEAEHRGYAINIPMPELTSEKLENAINEIINDPKYAKRAQEHGQLVMDQMETALDRAIWWCEYALRHPGLKHLRPPVHDMNFVQYFLLDVLGFIALIVILVSFILFKCCKCCFRSCCKSSKSKRD